VVAGSNTATVTGMRQMMYYRGHHRLVAGIVAPLQV